METTAVKRRDLPAELLGVRAPGGYSFDELYRFAQICHASGLYEDITDAAQAMIKIVRGAEMGFPPTTSMTAFDIIRKRLYVKPWAIAAKINACGYGDYRVTHQDPQACTILFRRKYPGLGWQDCPPCTYTIEEAKAHGLVERSPHWKASPAHMLYQRAMGRGGALYFPELLAGLHVPQDDTPVPEAQHQDNVVALFGDVATGSPSPLAPPLPDAPDAVDEALTESMWRATLEAHQDDPRLPEALRDQLRTVLRRRDARVDTEGYHLASVVLDVLDAAPAGGAA